MQSDSSLLLWAFSVRSFFKLFGQMNENDLRIAKFEISKMDYLISYVYIIY